MLAEIEQAPRPALSPSRRRRSLAAVMLTAAVFGLTYSLSSPLISESLSKRGYGELFIGFNAAMHALGVLLVTPVLPRMAARYGARRLVCGALCVATLVLLSFPRMPTPYLWFPLRIVLGMAAETLFVLSETWANELSTEEARSTTNAVYQATMSLGFAAGPSILSLVGFGASAYAWGAAIALCAMVPIARRSVVTPARILEARSSPLRYLRLAPVAIVTSLLYSAIETSGLSFIGLYTSHLGWSEREGMHLVSCLLAGAVLMQLPIGWLADRTDKRRLAIALAVVASLGASAWPWLMGVHGLAFLGVFVWGGAFVGIYTITVSQVGSAFRGADAIGVYALMGLGWGAGALFGPTLAGAAMELSARYGLPIFVAVACGTFALYMIVSRSKN